jgi:hypothetical protein
MSRHRLEVVLVTALLGLREDSKVTSAPGVEQGSS